MHELRLSCGTLLNLQVVGDRSAHRLSARLLGQKPKESILIEIPRTEAKRFELRLNDAVTVRGLAGRYVIGFTCSVIRVCTSPYRYFHLSYPEAIECSELRQSERVKVNIAVQVQTEGSAAVEIQMRDLSASGALLVGSNFGKVGDRLQLSFEFYFGKAARSVSLAATIRNIVEIHGADSPQSRIGVQFEDMSEADTMLLTSFIYETLLGEAGAISATVGPPVGDS